MKRHHTAAGAALTLLCALGVTPASAASEPATRSLPYGSTQTVRPGDRLTVSAAYGQAMPGDRVTSKALVALETLRMRTPVATATVTVACRTKPGVYPVGIVGPGEGPTDQKPAPWAKVRVERVDDAAVRNCRDNAGHRPPESSEERWGADTTWPQSPWDVRTFRPGSRITVTDNGHEGADGRITLHSAAFTGKPVLRGARAVLTAHATIKCGLEPGVYPVYQHKATTGKVEAELWARLRITADSRKEADGCRTEGGKGGEEAGKSGKEEGAKAALTSADTRADTGPGISTSTVAWSAGGVGAGLVAVGGAFYAFRKRGARRTGDS